MKEKNKNNIVLPIIGALVLIVASVSYIVMKISQQQAYNEKWKDYDDCGWDVDAFSRR